VKQIDDAIELLAKKITAATRPDDALKYTQAALNLAHVNGLILAAGRQRKEGASA